MGYEDKVQTKNGIGTFHLFLNVKWRYDKLPHYNIPWWLFYGVLQFRI